MLIKYGNNAYKQWYCQNREIKNIHDNFYLPCKMVIFVVEELKQSIHL